MYRPQRHHHHYMLESEALCTYHEFSRLVSSMVRGKNYDSHLVSYERDHARDATALRPSDSRSGIFC